MVDEHTPNDELSDHDIETTPTFGRRAMLKTVSAACMGTLPFVSGSAGATETEKSGEEAGINDAVEELLNERKFDQAYNILDENNVSYSWDKATYWKPLPSDNDSDGISTKSVYDKGKSEMTLVGWHKHSQVYRARAGVSLHWAFTADGPGPSDGYGISFGESRWESDGNYSGKHIKNS